MSVLKIKTENGYAPIGFANDDNTFKIEQVIEEDSEILIFDFDTHEYRNFTVSMVNGEANLSLTASKTWVYIDGKTGDIGYGVTSQYSFCYLIQIYDYFVNDTYNKTYSSCYGCKISNCTSSSATGGLLRYADKSIKPTSGNGLVLTGSFPSGSKIIIRGYKS